MEKLEALRSALPEYAKDIKLNVQSVLTGPSSLSEAQRWGVAVASAHAARSRRVTEAVEEAARTRVEQSVLEDAHAAAVIMAMNNVYYRFRHMVEKDGYQTKPARLRMNRLAHPAANKADFELFSLAVSAIHGCETCVQSHERAVIEGGLSEDHVHDAIRIAATVHAFAVSMDKMDEVATPPHAAHHAA